MGHIVRVRRLARYPFPVHWIAQRSLAVLFPNRRSHRPESLGCTDGPFSVVLLNAYGRSGATRSVFNLAEDLAPHRPVHLVSVTRRRVQPAFPFPDGVDLTVLEDRTQPRSLLVRVLGWLPSLLMHPDDEYSSWFSLWTDYLVLRQLRSIKEGVVQTTRPAVSLLASRVVRRGVTLIIQEHTHLAALAGELPHAVATNYGAADAVVLLTDRDRDRYSEMLAGSSVEVRTIPNAVPTLSGDMLTTEARRPVVLAAGRLVPEKGFDLLIDAFAIVTQHHPSWSLEIYGEGDDESSLAAQIERLKLSAVITLAGPTQNIGELMGESAVFALSSRSEGLPMVLLEAMSKAMPVVAFDCPTGPRELITDGKDGVLVSAGDVRAFAAALIALIDDSARRTRLGQHATATAKRYSRASVYGRWNDLLDDLTCGPLR